MPDETNTDTPSVSNSAQAPAQAVDGLTIQDLSTVMQIISVVQARGAFKAEEMVVVGAIYNKLKTFLDAAGASAAEQGNMPAAHEKATDSVSE